jgi:transposase
MDRKYAYKTHIFTERRSPPYSPNINLIEWLGKFMRKKVINTKFYRTKEEFRQAILKFFKNITQ